MKATLPSESVKGRDQCPAGRKWWRTTAVFMALTMVAAFSVNTANAQRVQDWLRLAEDALEENDPYGALRYMQTVMEADSNRAAHNYLYAEALRLNNQYPKAAYYYRKIYRRDQDRFFPEAGYRLAEMLKRSGDYAESKKVWRRIRDANAADPEGFKYRKALQEMRSCDLAEVWSKGPEGFELAPLPVGTNTEASEFAGTVTPSGHLVFSSLRGKTDASGRVIAPEDYRVRLYLARKPDWENPQPLSLLSETGGEANFAVSEDSTYTAFTLSENGKPAVYISGGRYGNTHVKVLPPADAPESYCSQPAFGEIAGEAVLFFTSDLEGGEGLLDIWYIALDNPDAAPVNPGAPVNSPGNEITPFFRKDKEQLYFASDWHHGFGGYDLFTSEAVQGKWSVPQNMKKPWNSPADDLYYRFGRKAGAGTVTSSRTGSVQRENEGCCNDLLRFDEAHFAYEDTLYISSTEELNKYLPVTLYFHNDAPDPRTRRDTTDRNYTDTYYDYLDMLPEYRSRYREGLDPEAGIEAEEAMDVFFLEKVDKGVNDLAFFTPLLLRELREGREIVLTVKGFASPLAETDYNVLLTSRRIVSLENYLRNYENGAFLPFLDGSAEDGGRLSVVRIPFGEYSAEALVTDNPNEADAVWSIGAASERKIEISSVQRMQADSTVASVEYEREIIDFAGLKRGTEKDFSFVYRVNPGAVLAIDSLVCDRNIIIPDEAEPRTEPGAYGVISGIFKTAGLRGKVRETITVYGNFPGGKRELNIVAEVE